MGRFILFFLLFLPTCQAVAGRIEAKVVGVSDGDTITVLTKDNREIKVRLYGVDAPESGQAYGTRAKQFTSAAVFGRNVNVNIINQDRYGRSVGIVTVDNGKGLNSELLAGGMAWLYESYCKRPECSHWRQLEKQARQRKIGLWQDSNPIAPWDFRRGKRATAPTAQAYAEEEMEYHGNRSSRIFHATGCRHYDCRNCTATFKNRDSAIKSGYKPCKVCKP